VLHDFDGTVRRAPTFISTEQESIPSLALAALQVYLGVPLTAHPDSGILEFAGRRIPVGKSGEMEIYFAGPPAGPNQLTFQTVSYLDVMQGKAPADLFKDKIVLVGITATAEPDRYLTPVSRGRPMYGVEILANIIESLWSGHFIYRTGVWVNIAIVFGLALVTSLICVRPWSGLLLAIGLAMLYFILVSWLFDVTGLRLDIFYPLFAIAFSYVMVTAYRFSIETRQRRRVLQLLEKRARPETAQATVRAVQKGTISLEGRVQEVTVVIAGLRGYETLARLAAPEAVLETVSCYWDIFTQAILSLDGLLASLEGDQATAFFNAPLPQPDHARRAVQAALAACERISAYHKTLPPDHLHRNIDLSFGVSMGRAIVGSTGTSQRQDYTVMGVPVSTAAQLATLGKPGQILLDTAAYGKTQEEFALAPVMTLPSREGGEKKPIYELRG
jgi:adenylate cyclase